MNAAIMTVIVALTGATRKIAVRGSKPGDSFDAVV
jgi:hypothetical protein